MCSVLKLFNLHSNLGKYIYHYHFVDKNLDKIKSQMSDSRLHIYIYIFSHHVVSRDVQDQLYLRGAHSFIGDPGKSRTIMIQLVTCYTDIHTEKHQMGRLTPKGSAR